MYKKINRIHLIGIGGIGVSGIAELLCRHGYEVSGSDLKESETVRRLRKQGIQVYIGHEAKNILGAELVVYSSAVDEKNPELASAIEKKIPVIRRAEMLSELMRIKYGIAVAGAHGKTTTTSMIATLLTDAGIDPTVVVGGRMDNFGGTNAQLGSSEFMVVEADESDGSFNRLSPSIAIVTNIDREHMDFYQSMRRVQEEFLSFLNKVPFYGLCVICGDDPYLRAMNHKLTRRKLTYGFRKENDYRVLDYRSEESGVTAKIQIGEKIETLQLSVPGKHNLLNALAALIVAEELSVPRSKALEGLRRYQGVQRRFQLKGTQKGVLFVDDYAHHPTEIKATLEAARERFPKSKINVIFQPHRFSRVEDLFDEFSTCFQKADSIYITKIYSAGEKSIPGIDGELLVDALRGRGQSSSLYIEKPTEAIAHALARSQEGDVIFTLGAGDLSSVYQHLF